MEHSAENDAPRASWLEAVVRAAVIDWNTNPNKPEGDVSLFLTRSLWPVLQEDRRQVWDEGYEAAMEVVDFDGRKVWAHTVMPDGYRGNPYARPIPPA